MSIRVIQGDCRDVLPTLPADSVHCVCTSPPYWGLRDYGVAGQIGLEPTFTEFIDKMVEVFREVRRVLRPDGTLWLNLGDSYAGGGNGGGGSYESERNWRKGNPEKNGGNSNRDGLGRVSGLKPKDLCGIPWRVAFALQADGWWLRQDIIWAKPNPMPESVTDRCTKAHEYLFLLTKSAKYYYDAEAIKEPVTQSTVERLAQDVDQQQGSWRVPGKTNGPIKAAGNGISRNRRSVWEIATQPFPEAHFATFPPALVEPCIKAGTSEKGCCAKCGAPWERKTSKSFEPTQSPEFPKGGNKGLDASNGWGETPRGRTNVETLGWSPTCKCAAAVVPCTVLDPFGGAGTTGLVAGRLQRNGIIIDINPSYVEMARRRITSDAPLFALAAE